ncbi:MAG TPA: metal ABC transporter permease [Actinomycetota bacterium]|nr:metal ABC transporter permease [Actinomycetota bacterium]
MIAALPLPYPFETEQTQLALVACLAVGVFAPTIGTFLVQKRLSLVGDGVGHVAFAGVGAGLLVEVWPVWTALLFAVAGAIGVEWLRLRRKAAGDLALALFFYVGIAMGAVFASRAGDLELETLPYLFGDPYRVTEAGVAAILALGAAVGLAMRLGARAMFAVVTDEDWSRVAGLPVAPLNLLLAGLTASVIVAGMRIVGFLLIAAMMVLPVASAQLLARSFGRTLRGAVGIGAASSAVGLTIARPLGLAPGGSIVFVAAAVFAAIAVGKRTAPRALQQEAH